MGMQPHKCYTYAHTYTCTYTYVHTLPAAQHDPVQSPETNPGEAAKVHET